LLSINIQADADSSLCGGAQSSVQSGAKHTRTFT